MRPIDADALLEKAYIPNTKILNGWWHKETLEDVRNAPTIEPKCGRWIEDGHYERCSECGEPTNEYHNYCPNCGARMENE